MKPPRWIGIGGAIATGKSSFAQAIRAQGYTVVDADQVAREVVEPGTAGYLSLQEHFPDCFDGPVLNRKRLGQRIFQDESQRLLLNSLLHPLIGEASRAQLNRVSGLVFYEAPLLFDSELLNEFELTIYVFSSLRLQLQRLMQRDQISASYAWQKMASFSDPGLKPSIRVQNNGSKQQLKATAEALLTYLE